MNDRVLQQFEQAHEGVPLANTKWQHFILFLLQHERYEEARLLMKQLINNAEMGGHTMDGKQDLVKIEGDMIMVRGETVPKWKITYCDEAHEECHFYLARNTPLEALEDFFRTSSIKAKGILAIELDGYFTPEMVMIRYQAPVKSSLV